MPSAVMIDKLASADDVTVELVTKVVRNVVVVVVATGVDELEVGTLVVSAVVVVGARVVVQQTVDDEDAIPLVQQ